VSVVLLVMTDGRDEYLCKSVASALAHLDGPITRRVMHDDTGDDEYRRGLAAAYPTFEHINGGKRQGFGGAIRSAWSHLALGSERYVWHHEADFIYNEPVPINGLIQLLQAYPHLVQVALRRQPWGQAEELAGGVVEQHPAAYTDKSLGKYQWLEHRLFLTTNPSIYRRTLCTLGWPEGDQSEGRFTHQLLRDGSPEVDGERVRFAYWGERDSEPWVTHIGHQRVGVGY
jgi:hypothetical protein